MTKEEAQSKIDYNRQLAVFGKERADIALQFFMLGANGYADQETQRLKAELEKVKAENIKLRKPSLASKNSITLINKNEWDKLK